MAKTIMPARHIEPSQQPPVCGEVDDGLPVDAGAGIAAICAQCSFPAMDGISVVV